MDAAEAAVGHHDYQIAIARFTGDCRDDRVDVGQVPRPDVSLRQIVDEP